MKKQRGITLIALVITIIILIILAGVSINITIGEDGIITKAKTAKEDFEVSVILEELELLKINMRLENKELNIENYLGELQKTNSISSTVDQIDKVDKNNAYVVLNEKYMFLIEDTNQNNVIITHEGIVGKLKPKIENVVVDNTNNSISVKVEAKRAENYKFYIKDSLEKEYELEVENDTGVYTYIDLTQNVMYYIKVEVINEEGSVTKELTSFTTNVSLETSEVNDKKIVLTAKMTENKKEISSYKFYVNETLIQTIETNDTSAAYTWTSTFGDHTGYVVVTDVEGNESVSDTIDFKDYTIATKTELEAFRDSVNNGNTYEGKEIIQTANINLQCTEGNQWIPIGNIDKSSYFNGTYDGDNNIIEEIYIDSNNSFNALFTKADSKAIIKNLQIKGNIKGNEYVAGIAAQNDGTIINCENHCNITGSLVVGGIVSKNIGTVSQCGNIGIITGIDSNNSFEDQGGIVAQNHGIVKLCFNKGDIINNSTSTGGYDYDVGGIVGQNANLNSASVENCYNTGNVIGENIFRIGGIIGWNNQLSSVKNCYNIGNITVKNDRTQLNYGSIVGENRGVKKLDTGNTVFADEASGILINTYYLSGTCEKGIGYGIGSAIEKSDSELKLLASTLGTEFKTDVNNINNGYPILEWQAK